MRKRPADSHWEYKATGCEKVDPTTLKEWKADIRRKNLIDMRNYLKRFPDATPKEKAALRSWVRAGHSPYDNGDFIAEESGRPMDFISAMRFMADICHEYLMDPDSFRERTNSVVSYIGDDDLPF